MSSYICWFEIPVTDLKKAVEFYSEVLRVKLEEVNFMGVTHAVFPKVGEHVRGALVPVREPISPGATPVLYFKVNDMALSLEAATDLGGKIVMPKTIMRRESNDGRTLIPETLIDGKQGYYALISDPDGNRLSLYSNA